VSFLQFKENFYLYFVYIIITNLAVIVIVEQDYDMAIKLYTDAINLDPFISSYYGNRSFAYIKTECYGYGLADANKALELDKTYVKVCAVYHQNRISEHRQCVNCEVKIYGSCLFGILCNML